MSAPQPGQIKPVAVLRSPQHDVVHVTRSRGVYSTMEVQLSQVMRFFDFSSIPTTVAIHLAF